MEIEPQICSQKWILFMVNSPPTRLKRQKHISKQVFRRNFVVIEQTMLFGHK